MDRIIVILIMGFLVVIGLKATPENPNGKFHGVSLVAPRDSTDFATFSELPGTGVRWVAIIPFAFSRPGEPGVTFDHQRQWWGERSEGTREAVKAAHALGLKVMIKPHVWVREQGWPGEYTLDSEEAWETWEENYLKYIMNYARIAGESGAELFCIGTEFRLAVRQRPQFWKKLIREVKKVYPGKLTYAANWDNFENIRFWSDLDYIGIDAYFPLSGSAVPEVEELRKAWRGPAASLKKLSDRYGKQVLFTEYGYRSTEYTADGHWKHSLEDLRNNSQGQVNGYEALYSGIWQEPWMAGGFLWKWHLSIPNREGFMDKAYSPQGKPAIEVIRKYYGSP